MDREEALVLLRRYLDQTESSGYEVLSARISQNEAFEVKGQSGKSYQIELDVLWDHKPNGAILIIGSIDDGGLRAFVPLTESRLLSPPGRE